MQHSDREVGLDLSGPRHTPAEARQIGEKLLLVDELEDTVELIRGGGEPADRVRALERRLTTERQSIQALETHGRIDYDEITRVMETIDRSG